MGDVIILDFKLLITLRLLPFCDILPRFGPPDRFPSFSWLARPLDPSDYDNGLWLAKDIYSCGGCIDAEQWVPMATPPQPPQCASVRGEKHAFNATSWTIHVASRRA